MLISYLFYFSLNNLILSLKPFTIVSKGIKIKIIYFDRKKENAFKTRKEKRK